MSEEVIDQPTEEVEINEEINQEEVTPEETTEETVDETPEDEVVVSIGDEPVKTEEPEEKAPSWVRELRKTQRELQRENRELKEKLKTQSAPAVPELKLGPKPTLDDFEFDADQYERALSKWYEDKVKVDEQRAKAEAEQQTQQQQWQAKLNTYGELKKSLKVSDFEDAEHVVQETFNQTQQGIILQGAENPALVVYALGKNPAKIKELASIKDPVKYAFAIAKLETQLKITPRKAPPPEKAISGTGPVSGSSDSTLERLRAEADKTGDYSKVVQYKRQKANK